MQVWTRVDVTADQIESGYSMEKIRGWGCLGMSPVHPSLSLGPLRSYGDESGDGDGGFDGAKHNLTRFRCRMHHVATTVVSARC
jgi:hypothetical protein